MGILFTNNAETYLAGNLTNVATTMTVKAGTGTYFPDTLGSDYFYVTLVDISGNREIIKVTEHQAGALDTFQTIVRGADGIRGEAGVGRAWTAGTDDVKVQSRINAAILTYFNDSIDTVDGLKHTQHTDTGTTSATFQLESGSAGVKLKNVATGVAIKNSADAAYVKLWCGDLEMDGDLTMSGGDLDITGDVTISGTFDGAIDNESVDKSITARDHNQGSTPEVVNVVMGTGSPPAANTTPHGTLWVKYTA